MTGYTDEIFGPVLCLVRADTYEQALTLINGHPPANGTAIFARDGGRPERSSSTSRSARVVSTSLAVPVAYYSFGGLEGLIVPRHPDVRRRGPELLYPRQSRHLSLARPSNLHSHLGFPPAR